MIPEIHVPPSPQTPMNRVTFEPGNARRSGKCRPLTRFGCRPVRFGFRAIRPSDFLSGIFGRPSFGCRLPIIGSVVEKFVKIRVKVPPKKITCRKSSRI